MSAYRIKVYAALRGTEHTVLPYMFHDRYDAHELASCLNELGMSVVVTVDEPSGDWELTPREELSDDVKVWRLR